MSGAGSKRRKMTMRQNPSPERRDLSPLADSRAEKTLAELPSPSASAWILVILAGLATLMGYSARGDHDIWGDEAVLEAVQAIDAPGLETAVLIANFAFDTTGVLLVALGLIVVAMLLRRLVFVLETAVVIALRPVVIVLKPIFASPRPGPEYHLDPAIIPVDYGYPSGHAFTATVVAGLFVLFVHSLDLPGPLKYAVIILAVAVTTLGMFARIWIGAHWPSDTIGGVLYGIAAIALMRIFVTFTVFGWQRTFAKPGPFRSLRR